MVDLTIKDGGGVVKYRKGRGAWSVGDPGVPEQDVNILATTSIIHDYVSIVDAETEYSKVIPEGCLEFSFRSKDYEQVCYAFETGKVATRVLPYFLHDPYSGPKEVKNLSLSGYTIYLSGTPGDVILFEFKLRA